MKPTKKMLAALMRCGVRVSLDDEGLLIQYFTSHGGDESIEIPKGKLSDRGILQAIRQENNYDVSYETYIWLDSDGHGKNGAPYELEDVLADKKEWKNKIEELFNAAHEVCWNNACQTRKDS